MSDNAQKIPFGRSLNRFAHRKIADATQLLGKGLPCTVVAVAGQIVTVNFDLNAEPFTFPNVSMPIATWVYDWIPVRIGDSGLTVPSDVYLGGVSGLGGGVADLTQQANLSSLVFLPVANVSWAPPGGDAGMRIVQGPDGVLLQDMGGACVLKITPAGATLLGNLAITGALTVTANITAGQGTADQVSLLNHTHGGVQTGAANTNKPNAGA